MIRRLRKLPQRPHSHRPAAFLAGVVGFMNFAFLIGIDLWVGNSQYRIQLIYGMTQEMIALLWLPIISIPLTMGIIYYTVHLWKHEKWSISGRIYYALMAVTAVLFLGFVHHWHLLGYVY